MQQRKKVLFTSHVANFAKFNQPFMRWFKQQSYEVHYASVGEELVANADKHFVISFERSPFKLNNVRAIKQLRQIIDSEGYDIIHTHTPMGSVITRIAATKARKNGTRVVYTAHGFHFFTGAPFVNWVLYYPIERIMARLTDTLVTINLEDYKRAKHQFKTNVEYVPGVGVDPDRFKRMTTTEKSQLQASLGIKPKDIVMVYAAEISHRKRQIWLINTLRELIATNSNFHLLLAGSDSLNGASQKLVHDYNLENNIHFLGYRSDIPQLMMISDIALSASSQEGLPVNIMEAMYAGLPIVATDCRGNRDLVMNGINGHLVDQNNSQAFTKRVEQLAGDKLLRVAMAKNGKRIIESYMIDVVIPKMASIYTNFGVQQEDAISTTEHAYGK